MSNKTKLMRVPLSFDKIVGKLSKKHGYNTKTEFLKNEAVPLFDSADLLSDLTFGLFKKRRRR